MSRLFALLVLICLGACGQEPVDPHAGHDHSGHEHASEGHEGHLHEAPRGGALVVLREEGVHVELLADSATGHLSVLVLGPHAAQPVRIAQASMYITLDVAGEAQTIELPAVASDLSGETVGDTSEFAAVIPVLVGVGTFSGSIASVTVRGETFTDLAFTYP